MGFMEILKIKFVMNVIYYVQLALDQQIRSVYLANQVDFYKIINV